MKVSFTKIAIATLVCLLSIEQSASARGLKIYLSVDMEGISGVVQTDQTGKSGHDYDIARKWMAEDTNAAIEGAVKAGATEIVVNDAHGGQRNLLWSDLNPKATLISGSPKPLGMMQGLDSTFDAVLFIGYHARSGTENAVLDHTNASSTVFAVKVNGVEMPELGLNAWVAGHYGVPVVFVSGDDATSAQTRELLGSEVRTASVKEAIGRTSAKLLSPERAHVLIRETVEEAIKKRKQVLPYQLKPPYQVELTYFHTTQADSAMLLPYLKRVGPRTVQFTMDDLIASFKLYRALLYLGEEE